MKIKFIAAVLGLTIALGYASFAMAGGSGADSEFMFKKGNVASKTLSASEMQRSKGNLINVSQILDAQLHSVTRVTATLPSLPNPQVAPVLDAVTGILESLHLNQIAVPALPAVSVLSTLTGSVSSTTRAAANLGF